MRLSSWNLRIIGLALFAMGLIVVSMAFISSEMDGYIMIFPFVFGNLKGLPAVALTLGSIIFYAITFLTPYYLISKENLNTRQMVYFEDTLRYTDLTDYIITVDFPIQLRDSFFMEYEENILRVGSKEQPLFIRNYDLPEGFEVEDYHHEFDDKYLILKLKLRKIA
jgi:hypothetical protein